MTDPAAGKRRRDFDDATQKTPIGAADPTLVQPGQRLPALGRYQLIERLGAGGMAEVFLAEQDGPHAFKKRVVIKRILPNLAREATFVQMFVREAQVAARLSHGNVVQIFELGEEQSPSGPEVFIAMEYIDGLTLQRLANACWAAGKAVPVDVVLRVGADAARGLSAAHALAGDNGEPLRLVHRDISPDNLMVTRDGITKVLDFGIAKGELLGPKTKTGHVRGKIPFMAPEQISGSAIDARTDLYALGVSLYWLLCGERPFDRDTDYLTMQAVLVDAPKSPRSLNPTIPEAFEEILLCLLRKNPADRIQNAAELADKLEALTTSSSRKTTIALVEDMLKQHTGQGNPLSEVAAAAARAPASAPAQAPNTTRIENVPVDWKTETAFRTPQAPPATTPPTPRVDAKHPVIDVLVPTERGVHPALVLMAVLAAMAVTAGAAFLLLRPAPPQANDVDEPTVAAALPLPAAAPIASPAPPPAAPAPAPVETPPPAPVETPTPAPAAAIAAAVPTPVPEAKPEPAPPKKPVGTPIAIRGGSDVSFSALDGARLVRMGPTLYVKPGTTQVRAKNKALEREDTVTIVDGRLDYDAVLSASLTVQLPTGGRARLGSVDLQPGVPLRLIPGRYNIRVWRTDKDGQEQRAIEKINVKAGENKALNLSQR